MSERFGEGDSDRLYGDDAPWPARAWVMAAIGSIAALVFQELAHAGTADSPPTWQLFGATFIAIATLAFVLTVERRQWWWSLLFALGWGTVLGLIAVSTRGYNRIATIFEFPFLASILAVLIAAPLFQAARDGGTGWRVWRASPRLAHIHAWTDAVIGAVAFLFVLIAFALAYLIAGLFNLIGIDGLLTLLQTTWFGFMLAGFAGGAAIGLLRERDVLVATMQRLVMVVLAVLAPVLAAALLLFLLSLPFTGLGGLFNGSLSAAALMLAAAGGAWLLINAVIGHGDEARPLAPVLRWSALALALEVLPLAVLAAVAMGLRIQQYGWTPERIWGVIATGVAIAYGAAGAIAVARGRPPGFAPIIRNLQVPLATGVCVLALVLALPIVDFGAISTRDQLARLAAGRVAPDKFDWVALAFDFGPAGRKALQQIARTGTPVERSNAARALAADNRYALGAPAGQGSDVRPLAQRLRVVPAGRSLPPAAIASIASNNVCPVGVCVAVWTGNDRFMLLQQDRGTNAVGYITTSNYAINSSGDWEVASPVGRDVDRRWPDLASAPITIGERRQRVIIVGGRPVRDIDDGTGPQP